MSQSRLGFTLIELLIVMAIVGMLAMLLFPVLAQSKTRATVARVTVELDQIGKALDMYMDDNRQMPPPARKYCTGMTMKLDDYHELPPELLGYIGKQKFMDPFNPGHAYKYTAPGKGYSNGVKTIIVMDIPEDYPICNSERFVQYENCRTSPIQWALWSVGPGGAVDWIASDQQRYPVRKSLWYPENRRGIICRFSDGRIHP